MKLLIHFCNLNVLIMIGHSVNCHFGHLVDYSLSDHLGRQYILTHYTNSKHRIEQWYNQVSAPVDIL